MNTHHIAGDETRKTKIDAVAASSAPVDERLSEQEVQDVIAEWNTEAAERDAASTQPSLAAVAATLDVTEAEARRLLTVVRAQRQSSLQAGRRRLGVLAAVAAGMLLTGGYLFNSSLEQTNRLAGAFTVDGTDVRLAAAGDNITAYPLDKAVTRMDVRLTYNPPSLWHYLIGPSWQPATGELYLVNKAGQRLETFPVLGGGSAGITRGWLRHTGAHEYMEGFAFPASALRGGGATLWFGQAADGSQEQTLTVPVAAQPQP